MPFDTGESYAEPIGPPEESTSAVASAAWENMGLTGTLSGAVIDGWKREGLSKMGKAVTPAEANKMFPGLNADRDITLSEADFIMSKREKVAENQQIIDSAADSFLKGTVVPFVAGAAKAMTDPVDMGINFITGGLGAGLAAGKGLAAKIAIDALEAGVGAAIAEAPVAMEMTDTFEEYTSKHFLTNVIGAATLQVGLMHGVPGAWKGTAKSVEFMGAKTSDGLLKFADVLEKKGINSTPAIRAAVDKITELTGKADEVHLSIKETLGGKVEIGDDMIDSLRNVIKAHDDGKITDAELISFRDHAQELGVDERVIAQAMDPEKSLEFNDAETAQIKEINNSPEAKQNYNPEAKKLNESLDDFDPDNFTDNHLDNEFDDVFGGEEFDFEGNPIAKEVTPETKEVTQVVKERNKGIQEKEFLRELAACRRGA